MPPSAGTWVPRARWGRICPGPGPGRGSLGDGFGACYPNGQPCWRRSLRENIDEEDVERAWEHSVLPYIEERLFGYDSSRLDDFTLEKLLEGLTAAIPGQDGEEPSSGAASAGS